MGQQPASLVSTIVRLSLLTRAKGESHKAYFTGIVIDGPWGLVLAGGVPYAQDEELGGARLGKAYGSELCAYNCAVIHEESQFGCDLERRTQ